MSRDLTLGTVAIVGGGLEAWMTAAALARATAGQAAITLVETLPAPTGAISSLPSLRAFHGLLGLDEAKLMAATRGTWKLSTRFSDWTRGASFHQAFGALGANLEGVPFHHYWTRLAHDGGAPSLDAFALAAVAAEQGRFAPPSPDPRSPLSTLNYGLHLDAAAYAAVLKDLAVAGGVAATRGQIASIERAENGDVTAVILTHGRRIGADLFVDCTGPAALLLGDEPFEDWSNLLPADRIVSVRMAGAKAGPLTQIQALDAGWRKQVPLRDGVEVSLAYRADLTFDTDAAAALTAGLEGAPSEPVLTALRAGRRARAMVGNVVAIGAAAGEVPALDAGPEHLIQGGVTRLIALFPRPGQTQAAAGEYNRLAAETIERLRDLATLRHRLARRPGAVWDLAREAPTPEGLAYKIAQFESRGRVVMYDEETFDEAGWTAALVGHGVIPRRHDPLVERMPLDRTRAMLDRMAAVLRDAAAGMPPSGIPGQ